MKLLLLISCIVVSSSHSGTLALYLRLAPFFVLLFRDPHLLKGAERCQDGATDPRTKPPLTRPASANNLQSHTLQKGRKIQSLIRVKLSTFPCFDPSTWGVFADKSRFKRSEKPCSKELPPVTITLPYRLCGKKGKN